MKILSTFSKVPAFFLIFAVFLLRSQTSAAQMPAITSVSSYAAAPGTSITITGTGFNAGQYNNIVYFGGAKADVTGISGTTVLTVTVPHGATYAPINVLNAGTLRSVMSKQFFLPVFSPGMPDLHSADFTPITGGHINMPAALSRLRGMATADLDEDGDADFVFTAGIPGNNTVAFAYNTSASSSINLSMTTLSVAGATTLGQPAIGDLDADGKPDIVLPSGGQGGIGGQNEAGEIYILRNTGNSDPANRFIAAETYPYAIGADTGPVMVAIADIDGDGLNDIAVVNYAEGTISLFRNTSLGPGDISFAGAITLTNVSHGINQSNNITLADLNNDGKPEILFSRANSNNISVLKNNSSVGSFNFATADNTYTTGTSSAPTSISCGDIDGDGKTDLLVTNYGASARYVSVFINTSADGAAISFDTRKDVSLATESGQYSASLGDLNGDGKPDVLVSYGDNFGTSPDYRIAVLANTTTGTGVANVSFGQPVELEARQFPTRALIMDLDNDGKPDVISGNFNLGGSLSIYRNTLQYPPAITSFDYEQAAPGTAITITGGNFNTTAGNNIVYFGATAATPDVATATSLTVKVPAGASYAPVAVLNTANTLSGKSSAYFTPVFTPGKSDLKATDFTQQTTITRPGFNLYGMVTTDLDGDKKPEIIETDRGGNKLYIHQNSSSAGSVGFTAPVTIDLGLYSEPAYPATGDLDGDGRPDLAVPVFGSDKLVIIRNTGDLSTMNVTADYATGNKPIAAAIADLDGDGKQDVVTANYGSGSISVFRNLRTAASISLDAALSFDTGPEAIYALAIADIDGDGKQDIITQRSISASTGSHISFYKNTSVPGTISFAGRINLSSPSSRAPGGIAVGDIDGDGKTDIIVANSSNTFFSVFHNIGTVGTASFSRQDFNTAKGQGWVSLGDVNGDGKPDVVLSLLDPVTGSDYKVTVFPNTSTSGNVSFGTGIDLDAGNHPQVNIIQDFDGDGKPDILSGNYNDHSISVHRNTLITTPVTQASDIAISNLTGTTATISWTNGDGAKRVVFMKADNTGTPSPADGTDYTADADFGSGTQIGSSGWYAVYNGTGSTVDITGLSPSATYQVMVTEYNDNDLTGAAQYQIATATGNPVNFTTLATLNSLVKAGISPSNAAAVDYTATFGSAVSGLTTANFSVSGTGGISGASVAAISGSGTTYTVTVNTGTGDGDISLSLASITGLSPALTNTLPFAGEIYTIDKTIPTLSSVATVSNNTNPAAAKTGDAVTLSFTASETIATPVVTIAGHTVTVTNTGGDSWLAVYTLAASDGEGAVPFSIGFTDEAGNAGTDVTATTDGSLVSYDKTLPILSPVVIASNNADATKAKAGDAVTLTFTASETIATPVVTIAGHTVTVTNTGGDSWSAGYTLSASDAEGIIPFSIAFNDGAGNAGTDVTATTDGSLVRYDKTAPALTTVNIASDNTNPAVAKSGDAVTLSFTASETIATPVVTIAGHTVTVTNTGGDSWLAVYTLAASDGEGAVPFSIGFTDEAGNAGTDVTATTDGSLVRYDKTAPALTTVNIASDNTNPAVAKSGDAVTLSFTASETIATPVVTIAGHTVTVTNTGGDSWSAGYTLAASDGEGAVPFSIGFTDEAGNAGTDVTATTDGSLVSYDKTLPILSPVVIASNNADATKAKAGDAVTLTFTASETIATPVVTIAGHTVTVTNTGGDSWSAGYTLSASDAEGIIPFSIAFNDGAGNAGTDVTATTDGSLVRYDKTAPALTTVNIASDNTNPAVAKSGDAVTLSFTASETIATPVVTIAGHTVTVTNTGGDSWLAVYTLAASDGEGTVPFSIGFSDLAGNADVTVTRTTNNSSVTINHSVPPVFVNTPPTLSPIADQSTCYNTIPQTIAMNGITAGSESGQSVSLDIRSSSATLLSGLSIASGNNGTGTITYTPADPAGGTAIITVTVTDDGGTANGGTDTYIREFRITVNPLPVVLITADRPANISRGERVVLTASGGTNYVWANAEGIVSGQNTATLTVRPAQNTTYTVTADNGAGCTRTASFAVGVSVDYRALQATNILTPNNDGVNDTWQIRNIDMYPDNEVRIVDKAGRVLYSTRGYDNNEPWDGTLNGVALAEDTYYYIIRFGAGKQIIKGYITVIRDR